MNCKGVETVEKLMIDGVFCLSSDFQFTPHANKRVKYNKVFSGLHCRKKINMVIYCLDFGREGRGDVVRSTMVK